MIQSKNISFFSIILLFIFLILLLIPNVSASFFDDFKASPITLDLEGLHESPSIALWDKNVHIVWNFWPDEFNCSIYYKKSIDNGENWDDSIILSSNISISIYPVIAVYNETIHVAWKDYINGNPEIYYINSYDNGDTWNDFKRITFNSSRLSNIFDIRISVDESDVFLVWKDYRSGSSEIFFKKSSDNGKTWLEDQRLTHDYHPSYFPAFIAKNKMIYLVYEDRSSNYNIGFLKSIDSGDTWYGKKIITNSEYESESPYIFLSNDILYLTWQEDISGKKVIFFKKSDNLGDTWSDFKKLTSENQISRNPILYVYNENIILIYQKYVNYTYNIFYKSSKDLGETWSEEKQLVSNIDCYSISVEGYQNNIHIVWQDYLEATWSDIWHMGNYNVTIIPPNNSKNDGNDTPGFDIIFYIMATFIIVIIAKNKLITKIRR